MERARANIRDVKMLYLFGCAVVALLLIGLQAQFILEAYTVLDSRELADLRNSRKQIEELGKLKQERQERQATGAKEMPARFSAPFSFLTAVKVNASSSAPLSEPQTELGVLQQVFMPGLNGIIQEQEANGRVRFRACFEQGVFSAGEKVGEFRIREVMADRVVLARQGETFVVRLEQPGASR